MRSPSNSPPTLPPSHQGHAQQFVIPPFERLRFVILFVLATGLGWFLIGAALQSLQNPILATSLPMRGLLSPFIGGLVSGLMVGATQWIVLRRYLPDWFWILTNTAGYVLLMTTLQAWQGLLANTLKTVNLPTFLSALSPFALSIVSGILSMGIASICAVWLGVFQWLVLRQYARNPWGWIFVPSIAVLLSSALLASGSAILPKFQVALTLEPNVLAAGILGTTQAIAVCVLQQKPRSGLSDPHSLWAIAPAIRGFRKVQRIAKRLKITLKEAWQDNLGCDRPLTYRVGVTEEGAIAVYEPTDLLSANFVQQIPLSELAVPTRTTEQISLPAIARFQVTFTPSRKLTIRAWRGIPVFWLGLGMVVVVIAASVGGSYLKLILPDVN